MVRFRFSCIVEPMKLGQMVALLYNQEVDLDPEVMIVPERRLGHHPQVHDVRTAVPLKPTRKGPVKRSPTVREHSLKRIDVLESYMKSGPKTFAEMGEALEMAGFRKASLNNMLGPLRRAGRLVNDGGMWKWVPTASAAA